MHETSLTLPRFTIDASIPEWLAQKRTTRSGSDKTTTAYRETIASFRQFLAEPFHLDLLDNPIDIARLAPLWASTRLPVRLTKEGTPNKRHTGQVSNSTYNQRLAILSSWYSFVQRVYHLDIPNPIKDVSRRNVQAYAEVLPIGAEVIETGLSAINRDHLQGLRDYAILAVALYTGRRAHELVGLSGNDVQILDKGKDASILLRFHCKGGKIEYNLLDSETSGVLLEYLQGQHPQGLEPGTPVWVSYSKQNKGQRISVQTLSMVCRQSFGTSKNHRLRHTFADELKNLGAPITDIAAALGHTDIKITQRYMKQLDRLAGNPLGDKLVKRFGIRRKGD